MIVPPTVKCSLENVLNMDLCRTERARVMKCVFVLVRGREREREGMCVRENDEMWVCQREKDSEKVDEMCL